MKVSVIIPSFNRAHFLERTIGSVINQIYKDMEIIVVDDCSEDNTFEVVQSLQERWKEYDIFYIKHKVNKGESGSRNTGIRVAKGDYVAFLDSDDEWIESKLSDQMEFLNRSPFYDGVVSEYYSIIEDHGFQEAISLPDELLNAKSILIKGTGFSIGTTLILKKDKITEFFDENLRLFADLDWLYRTLHHCKIGIVHKPLARYYKSPMRPGSYIKEHAAIFIAKYKNTLKKLSFFERSCFFSTINWYIALAYDYHNEYGQAIPYYIRGFMFMPFRRLGNYFHVLKLCFSKIIDKK